MYFYPGEYNVHGLSGVNVSFKPKENGFVKENNIYDHLGSVRSVFDTDINVLSKNDYMPFGEKLISQGQDERSAYVGKENDNESNLADHGVRKLDYLTGRFTAPDKLWELNFFQNPYHYSRNNPLVLKDIDGYLERDIFGNINAQFNGNSSHFYFGDNDHYKVNYSIAIVKTDLGNEIELWYTMSIDDVSESENYRWETNCFGYCIADGEYWVSRESFELVLDDEYYTNDLIDKTPQVGDIVVYYDADEIVHAEKIIQISENGEITVEGKAGNQPKITTKNIDDVSVKYTLKTIYRKKESKKSEKDNQEKGD